MTRQQALTLGKQQADEWYEREELKYRTQQAIERGKNYVERYEGVRK